jgi:hypothetical protein
MSRMVEMSIRFGEGDGVVADVADRTGWGLKRCQDVEHSVFNRRYRRRKEPSAGDGIPNVDHAWLQDLRVDVIGTWNRRDLVMNNLRYHWCRSSV